MRGSIAILALCAASAACGGGNDDTADDTALRAQVRVVHAVVDAPVLEVYTVAAARLPAFPNIASGSATGYVGLDEGADYRFIVRQPGDPDIFAQLDLPLGQSERKLLLISGARTPAADEQPITITAFDDTRVETNAGTTQLRVVNASLEGATLSGRVTGLVADAEGQLERDEVVFDAPSIAGVEVLVPAGEALPLNMGGTSFTIPSLPSSTAFTVALVGSRNPDDGEARALRLLNIPAVGISNTTATSTTAQDPFVVVLNAVPGGGGSLAIDDVAVPALPFAAISPRLQVRVSPTINLDGEKTTLGGALDPATTYLVVIAPNATTGGITAFAYSDALADGSTTRIRAINATVGSGARDIALSPAPVLGTDLVVGAASPSPGTLVTDPAAITAITATPAVGAPFVYTTGIDAGARYVVLVGDAAAAHGAVVIAADWSATFVPVD